MTTPQDTSVLLTVRGTYIPANLDAARTLHNDTAGSEQGIAAARSLGDLSHKVYAPCAKGGPMSNAKTGELLFVDTWTDPGGIQTFFSNEHVVAQADKMFSARNPTVWMPARGSFSFNLPAAMDKQERYVGMLRAPVKSPEAAIAAFGEGVMKGQRAARQRGQLSHQLFIKLTPPGSAGPVEVLGLDLWSSLEGMLAHYGDEHMAVIRNCFAGAPDPSIWEQPSGRWSEW